MRSCLLRRICCSGSAIGVGGGLAAKGKADGGQIAQPAARGSNGGSSDVRKHEPEDSDGSDDAPLDTVATLSTQITTYLRLSPILDPPVPSA